MLMTLRLDLTKKTLAAIASPVVEKALVAMRKEGRNPKTKAALRTALISQGIAPRDADKLCKQLPDTAKWGDGRNSRIDPTVERFE